MSAPPVPPRPYDHQDYPRQNSNPPPIPPLPPNFRPDDDDQDLDSPPHFTDPLVAPRPQKLQPDVPADIARQLDEQMSFGQMPTAVPMRLTTPQPPPPFGDPGRRQLPNQPTNYNPGGFVFNRGPSPAPPPHGAGYPGRSDSFPSSNTAISYSQPTQPPSFYSNGQISKSPSPPRHTVGPPSLTAPLPTLAALSDALPSVQAPTTDPAAKVAWCRDVLSLVGRASQAAAGGSGAGTSTDPVAGPARVSDPSLARLADIAVPLVKQLATSSPGVKLPLHVAEAIYLRATLAASGAFPQQIPPNPRVAFRDFEQAARAGYHAAWFKLGRDYENFGDDVHARECFERGIKFSVESCLYRMGMAHLMGQLGLQAAPEIAVPLLHRAATLATIDVPQPAYVYSLLLLAEFSHVTIPPNLFAPLLPAGSTPLLEGRKHLERAAYLNFAPAQYKLGHAYEFALSPFPYDALLSVQYYSLASQQGEIEADMALSKWFLCGAEGSFEKDEGLAYTFAEKAARKGLPSAEFAMGYYKEVGVGGPKDIEAAKTWYQRAADHGNADAPGRLNALSQALPQTLSREEHDTITESKLVRKRTQAKQRSDAVGAAAGPIGRDGRASQADASQVVEVIRRHSKMTRPGPRKSSLGAAQASQQAALQELPPMEAQPLPQQQQRPPPPQQQQFAQQPAHSNTMPPGGAPLRPPAQRHGYSLSDNQGGNTAPPAAASEHPRQAQRYGPGRGRGRVASASSSPAPSNPASPNPGPGPGPPQAPLGGGGGVGAGPEERRRYDTFQSMGIQAGKPEEKECVIM